MSKEVVFSYFVFYLVTIKAEIDVGYDVNQTTTVQYTSSNSEELKNNLSHTTEPTSMEQKIENLQIKLDEVEKLLRTRLIEHIDSMSIVNNGRIEVSQAIVSYPERNKTNETSLSSVEKLVSSLLSKKILQLEQSYANGQKANNEKSFDNVLPKHCSDIQGNMSGVYIIKPPNSPKSFMVFCDMETQGGGWTVFQRRFEGSIDFYRGWNDYKYGFGNIANEYWLGLEKLQQLVSFQINELYIELEDFENEIKTAHYSLFGIGSEEEGYRLNLLGLYTGTAGDSLKYHVGQRFATHDRDGDEESGGCAENYVGAWWYKTCHVSNLNGKYLKGIVMKEDHAKGMCWHAFRGYDYSLMKSKMMVRPRKSYKWIEFEAV